jgi:aryl carrier-like protein
MHVTGVDMHDTYHYPLRMLATVAAQLDVAFQYDAAVFDATAVEALADVLLRVLRVFAADTEVPVGDIEVFDRVELAALVGRSIGADVARGPDTDTAATRVPVTPVECAVAAAFEEVLGVENVGADDNFFELGGHSLSAMSVVVVLREAGIQVPLPWLFSDPTPAAIARKLEADRVGPAED